MADLSVAQVRVLVDRMRALGFDMPARYAFASRSPYERFETPVSRGGRRLVG
jgi:hypothetical protein